MIEILERLLYGEMVSCPYRQDTEIAPDVSKESATDEEEFFTEKTVTEPQKSEPEIDPEILAIVGKYGPIAYGVVIEVSLQELLALIPKQRRRSDAYASLQKKLLAEYGTELKIITRKGGIKNG